MYHFNKKQLRVCGKYVRLEKNKQVLIKTRFIILQHLLPDTEELIELLLSSGAEIFCFFAKPYSIDKDVLKRLDKKINIINKSYNELETSEIIINTIKKAIDLSKKDGKKIIIHEVGGYFAKPLSMLKDSECSYIAGIVEDTTFGHNRYHKIIDKIKVPVFSVARSALKEIEARFVGKSAVTAVEQEFRKMGTSISSRHALVIGYGMIGKNVARSLRDHDLTVSVYDKNDHRNINAFSVGYKIHKKIELIKSADIIFSATGESAITISDLEMTKNNVVLASVGSKNIEFDVEGLANLSIKHKKISSNIIKYTLPTEKNIFLFNSGTAVNFIIDSVPSEIIDIVFSEILICIVLLLTENKKYDLGLIHKTPEENINHIAKDWLKFINH